MSLLRDNSFTAKAVKDMNCRGRGTEASKEETNTTNDDRVQHCVEFLGGIQCDDQLVNSSAQTNFDNTITSLRQLVCGADFVVHHP